MNILGAGVAALVIAVLLGLLTRFDQIAWIIGVLGVIAVIVGLFLALSNRSRGGPVV